MRNVLALFLVQEDASRAVEDLSEAGFEQEEVSVFARRDTVEDLIVDDRGEAATESASVGALGGTALGGLVGLIAGASAMIVPGIGPALAAGTWATVLGTTAAGAGIGAAYGGLVGALIGFGVAEEQTHVYVEGVQKGGLLVLVQPEDDALVSEAKQVLESNNGSYVEIVEEPE